MQNSIKHNNKISSFGKLGYGMGNFSYGIISQVIGFYIVFYATSVLEISGILVGMVVGISVIWDALTDPIMGYLSDITKSRFFGRRHGYILFGGILMAVTTLFLYNIKPDWSDTTKLTLMIILLLLSKTFTTVYTTPLSALGAELSDDYIERTSIQGYKTAFFLTGIICATGMGLALFFQPTSEYPKGQLNPMAYQHMGIVVGVLALIFGLITFFSTFKYIKDLPKVSEHRHNHGIVGIFSNMFSALKNKNYRLVVLGYLFTNISSGIFSTIGLHVYTYTFKLDNSKISIIFGVQFLMCILAQPLWVYISTKIDKRPTVLLGLFTSILGSIFFAFLVVFRHFVEGNFIAIIPFAILTGFGIAGLFSLPLSMVADTIDIEDLNTGERNEGVYFGLLTLAYKSSQAVVIFLLGFLLDLVKFDSNAATQPERTVIILGMTIAVGSSLAFAIAMFFYNKYDLNAKKVREIQKEIIEKKKRLS